MKRVLFFSMILATGIVSASASEGTVLKGDAVRKAVAGKTVYLKMRGIELPIAYRSNGTMTGKMQTFSASMVGNSATKDSGRWWVTNNQLCQRWNSWLGSRSYCFKLRKSGSTLFWTSNNGRSGTARVSG